MPPGGARQLLHRAACAAATSPPSARSRRARRAAAWNTYVWVDDADETAAQGPRRRRPRARGSPSTSATRAAWRCSPIPRAPTFRVWQAKRHRGAAVVNEPGSLNFNDLHTATRSGAQRVLRRGVRLGAARTRRRGRMWALPAYGDFLEERTPGMREQHGRDRRARRASRRSSPAAVPVGRRTSPPHWSVTFAVDDADAIAEPRRAARRHGARRAVRRALGRTTVIADPQGATFTASKFVPENKDLAPPAGAAAA